VGKLQGRRALITGAGQGVGRGIAIALAAEGAAVSLVGRTEAKVQAVAHEIDPEGVRAIALGGDVTSPGDLERCVAATVQALGGLEIVVNNAQQFALGTLLDVTDEQIQSCWESGPLATFRLMKLCYPHLRGDGVIINVGSSTSVNPTPTGRGVYGAVKAATQTLSRVAASEWGVDGIRVVNILPAATSPPAEAWRQAQPEAYEQSMASIPLRRLGDPVEDIGRAVAFLCGPDAAYVTGTTLTLDGGQAYLR
jgi:meso-butanediol dehydrogenase/(S,S)-butanediol dehydrogenase/diacetyl reductase